jgi:hypothetical protein
MAQFCQRPRGIIRLRDVFSSSDAEGEQSLVNDRYPEEQNEWKNNDTHR